MTYGCNPYRRHSNHVLYGFTVCQRFDAKIRFVNNFHVIFQWNVWRHSNCPVYLPRTWARYFKLTILTKKNSKTWISWDIFWTKSNSVKKWITIYNLFTKMLIQNILLQGSDSYNSISICLRLSLILWPPIDRTQRFNLIFKLTFI